MSNNSKGSRKRSSSESDFKHALSRLLAGKPQNNKLKALAARNRLKISISTVSLEAGRSRTLIGTANCAYPEIRAAILRAAGPRKASKAQSEIIQDLRTKVKSLTEERAIIATQLAEAVGEIWRLKKLLDFQREINKAKSSKKVVSIKG